MDAHVSQHSFGAFADRRRSLATDLRGAKRGSLGHFRIRILQIGRSWKLPVLRLWASPSCAADQRAECIGHISLFDISRPEYGPCRVSEESSPNGRQGVAGEPWLLRSGRLQFRRAQILEKSSTIGTLLDGAPSRDEPVGPGQLPEYK